MYDQLQSWRKVAEAFDLPVRTIHRYATDPDYEPKRLDIREKLGLEPGQEVTFVRQVRDRKSGRFS